jgi:hypothetical protein
MAVNINGRMKVKTLRADFKKEFGLTLRVYDGRSFADDDSTLASIRKGDSKGGDFGPRKNTKVGNLEDKIMDLFGIKTQVAGSDDSYLCDNDFTLAKALEVDGSKLNKKSNKVEKINFKQVDEDYDSSDNSINEDQKIGMMMLTAVQGIGKWLRLEQELTHIEVHQQAINYACNQVVQEYGLTVDQVGSAVNKGGALAKEYFDDAPSGYSYRRFMKGLEAYHYLEGQDLGMLVNLLIVYSRLCYEYEPENIASKFCGDIVATINSQFECEHLFEQASELVENQFEDIKMDAFKHYPIDGFSPDKYVD